MRTTILAKAICICILLCVVNASQDVEQLSLPSVLKEVCWEEGKEWIEDPNTDKESFEATVIHGVTQDTNSYCGVASSVIVLNSLDVYAPTAGVHNFPYFDQENFFSDRVESIITADEVLHEGFTLDQLAQALKTWEYGEYDDKDDRPKTKTFIIEDVVNACVNGDKDQFRLQVRNHMASPKGRIIANFDREALGQGDHLGHFSPIIAYNQEEDSVLLYDVARYKFPCPTYWVPVDLMFSAMCTKDSTSGTNRGYIVIDDPLASHNEDSDTDEGATWYIILFIVMGATFYVSVTCVAIVLICTSLFLVFKNRGKRVPVPSSEI